MDGIEVEMERLCSREDDYDYVVSLSDFSELFKPYEDEIDELSKVESMFYEPTVNL